MSSTVLKERNEIAILMDVDDEFGIKIHLKDNEKIFHWFIKTHNSFGEIVNVMYQNTIDDDIFPSIARAFTDYPKWW